MIGALQKREKGIVTYKQEYCSGCRYCQVACPFEIPKFEWASRAPLMVKCELCNHRLAEGKLPGCVEVCPRQAVIYGTREALLAEAKKRIADHPDRYRGYKDGDAPRVFGETDGGGTQCLVLSHVPYEKLGLPALEDTSHAVLPRSLQHGVYRGMIAPIALYAVLGAVVLRNKKKQDESGGAK
jgi:Fe-S-cluster-containing dehydrogenase component